MAHDDMSPTDRREFLQAGALVAASAAGLAPGAGAQERRSAAAGYASQAAPRQDRRSHHPARHRHRAGTRRRPLAPLRVQLKGSAPSTPPLPISPNPTSRPGSSRSPPSARRSSSSRRSTRPRP